MTVHDQHKAKTVKSHIYRGITVGVAPHPHANPVRRAPFCAALPWMWSHYRGYHGITTVHVTVQTSTTGDDISIVSVSSGHTAHSGRPTLAPIRSQRKPVIDSSDATILVFGIRYDIDTIRYDQYRLDISFGRYIVASLIIDSERCSNIQSLVRHSSTIISPHQCHRHHFHHESLLQLSFPISKRFFFSDSTLHEHLAPFGLIWQISRLLTIHLACVVFVF